MKRFVKSIVVLVYLLWVAEVTSGDTVELQNGTKLKGKILSETSYAIVMEITSEVRNIEKTEVRSRTSTEKSSETESEQTGDAKAKATSP